MPAPTAPVARPRSIRAVRILLVVTAVAGGLNAVTAPLTLIEPAVSGGLAGQADPVFGVAAATVLGALSLLAGAGLVRPIGRGVRAARVLAWVAAAVVAAGELFQISADSGEFLGDLLPAWYLPVYYTGQVVCLAALVAVAWLLVVRSAGDFFDANAPSSPADEARIWDISKVRGRSTSGR